MTAYKCIRCGKQMDIGMDDKAGECGFCGSVQALPFIRNETMAKSYLTANSYFVENEYIKAEGYYEQLAKENPLDPLPQWMLLLCEYGVQYCRENDSSHWKPTIHRFQERRVVSDASYVATIRLADEGQRALFECEAEELERLRQRIQTVSEKEMPVDVFISYKDKDDGILTNDHTWAETLYHDLKRQGLRVFYAPVSLRGKVGDFYEPYIYAAIHSAKVMIVLGTKREYFNSPWIRNEWDRYLTLKNDEKDARLLMVVYRNMTPDELPEQLLHSLQPIEMKDDWLQTVESRVASVVSATGMELPRILKRGFDFLERGDTERADRQFETMLNTDNQSKTAYAMAYVGKLMLDLNVKTLQELSSMKDTFDTEENYQMAIREDSPSTTGMLEDITRRIIEKKEYKRQLAIYDEAKAMIEGADGEEPYRKAAERLSLIFGFQDASELHTKCLEKAEEHRKDAIYQSAIEWMGKNTVDGYTEAIKKFNSIPEWRDSLSQAEKCRGEIERLRTSAYTQGKGKMMEAASEQDFAMAAACFETAGGYEESVFLAEYSRKAGREAFVNATFVDMIESMYQGNIERFDEASDHLQKLFSEKGMEQIAQFRKWAEEQQKKRKIKVLLGRIETGGIIQLGNYPQDNEGKLMTPIEWIVLERQGDEFLLISKYALDCQPYNTEKKEVTWETCSLRRWLNGVFYEAAFSEKEKEMIMDTELANKDNPKYGTKGGNPTTDRVFLLSIEDAEKYFGSDEERKCVPTKLARTKSIVEYERWYEGYKGTNKKDFLTPNSYAERLKTACWWWLRSPGLGSDDAADVGSGGSLRFNGYWVSNSSDAVRPSLRLHL